MSTYKPGDTISCGILLINDLLPKLLKAARQADPEADTRWLDAIESHMKTAGYYQTEDAEWDLVEIIGYLEEKAPEGTYFGAHPEDPTRYGFWPLSSRR